MQRFVLRVVAVCGLVVASLAVAGPVLAHQTEDCPNGEPECPVATFPRWRENLVPLFGTEVGATDGERTEERHQAERWRDEWGCDKQFCGWIKPSGSVDDHEGPATLHAGIAGEHALGEAAHSDECHDADEFCNHDSHGGTIYADICLGTDNGTGYQHQAGSCEDMYDTQFGIVIKDHLTCPACMDEYHQVRPLDAEYTAAQVGESERGIQRAACNPSEHVIGYGEAGPDPAC
jgi:hypothetical protein